MHISSADPLKGAHSAYVVAAHLNEPLLEQVFVTHLAGTHKLNRQLANRVLATQAVGNIFTLGTRHRGPMLVCLVIGHDQGQAQLSDMNLCIRKMMSVADATAAVVAEGFRLAHPERTPEEYGFECLRRSLKRWGFAGTVYVRPEPEALTIEGVPQEESLTDRRFIARPDGTMRPSIIPGIAALGSRKPVVKIKM